MYLGLHCKWASHLLLFPELSAQCSMRQWNPKSNAPSSFTGIGSFPSPTQYHLLFAQPTDHTQSHRQLLEPR